MPAIFTHNGEPCTLGVFLNGMTDVSQSGAGADLLDAQPHAFIGGLNKAAGQDGRFADEEHAAGVTEPAILDDGDVNVHDVAVLQNLVTGYAVTDHVIDGRADG